MNSTTNMICVFVAGIAVGALGAVGVMKHLGYAKPGEGKTDEQEGDRGTRGVEQADAEFPEEDKPSFVKPERMNTAKVTYHIPSKPDLAELAAKYNDESFNQHMAEREYPEENDSDEDLQAEIADALMEHPGQYEDGTVYDTDGYGHVMMQLATKRKDSLIYLVNEEWSGEIYPIEDLRWFEKDDVLVDVTDAPVDDPERIIGSALGHFGECGDPDKVYVRNASIGFEYEITRVDGSYGSYIYGVSDEESEIPPKKGGTHPAKIRKQKMQEEGAVTL